jgi:hypothetical protein
VIHQIIGASCLAPFRPGHDYRPALDEIAALGYGCVRTFCGPLPWCNQTREAVYAGLPRFLDHCHNRGLNAYLPYITEAGTGFDLEAHVRELEAIANEWPAVVLKATSNESNHPSQGGRLPPERCRDLAAMMRGPVSFGADLDDESTAYTGGAWVSSHLDRGRPAWNWVRRVREQFGVSETVGKPVLSGEPMGADEQANPGKRESAPELFFTLGALNRLFLGGSGVFHSQSGLMAERLGPNQRRCAEAYLAGVRLIPGAHRLTYKNAGHDGSPVKSARFNDGDMGKEGCCRAYSGIEGDTGFSVVLGVVGNSGVDWAWQHERIGGMNGVEIYRVAR